MGLDKVYKPIKNELNNVEKLMISEVSNGSKFITRICEHAFKVPGKRLRPALVLFSAKVGSSKITNDVLDVAAAVELIHTATLIQDDHIDKAMVRRGQKTVGTVFGGSVSILFGDYLFSKSFSLLAKKRRSELLYLLSEVTNAMAAGEMEQLFLAGRSVSEQKYFDMIMNKTARLFSASCEMGAIIGGLKNKQIKAMSDFGLNFGMAYQIIDDCLDITSNVAVLKKTTGLDVKSGKKTLPAIYRSTEKAKNKARTYISLALKDLEGVIPHEKQVPFKEITDYALSYI